MHLSNLSPIFISDSLTHRQYFALNASLFYVKCLFMDCFCFYPLLVQKSVLTKAGQYRIATWGAGELHFVRVLCSRERLFWGGLANAEKSTWTLKVKCNILWELWTTFFLNCVHIIRMKCEFQHRSLLCILYLAWWFSMISLWDWDGLEQLL